MRLNRVGSNPDLFLPSTPMVNELLPVATWAEQKHDKGPDIQNNPIASEN